MGTVQAPYTANLSSTGGKAPYTWTISSGQLPTGLSFSSASGAISGTPTQALLATFVFEVTDSSTPTPESATQSLKLDITGPLQVSSSSLPNGTTQTPYAASLSATGGIPPYTWSISSGSLPPGVTLVPTTNAISGFPTQAGTYAFQGQVSDAISQTSSAKLSINVVASSSASACGPPVYCARSDENLQLETPMAPPAVAAVFNDPDFGSRMVRVTDGNTMAAVAAKFDGISFLTPASAEDNTFAVDSQHFFVIGQGGNTRLYGLDPATMNITPITIPNATWGDVPVGDANFSRTNPDLIYGVGAPQVISSFSVSTSQTATVVDTRSCVPNLPVEQHTGAVSVSAGDAAFSIIEGGAAQDADMYAVVYVPGQGCRWYNTQTGQIGGQWGPVGQAPTGLSFLMHNAHISLSGQYLVLDVSQNLGTVNLTAPVFWDIASTSVSPCTVFCNGHKVGGYAEFANPAGTLDETNIVTRTFASPAAITQLISSFPQPVEWTEDRHLSWNDDNSTDTMPLCLSQFPNIIGSTSILRAWDREIVCVRTDGVQSEAWRFAHNRSIDDGNFWSTPRGNVSPDGRFYMFTSNWNEKLGADPSGVPRTDVFIVELY